MEGSGLLKLFPAQDFALIGVILLMPLLGAFVNGVWGNRLGKPAVKLMALGAVGASFLASVVAFFALHQVVEGEKGEHVKLAWTVWEWMHTTGQGTNVPIDVKFSIDQLSGVMMLVVTGVGFLIHLYATSYMQEDASYARFFCYLNLFIFAMLVLILGDNLPLLFVGWEGVGLCSYLLIGFWYGKDANASAGKKAFIANRIGDFGLLCAMFLLAWYTGALDWDGIAAGSSSLVSLSRDARVHVWPIGGGSYQDIGFIPLHILQPAAPITISAATAVALALLLGCTGKSAQIPLYVWLPDAMAGPTPVSALIHAATMVTAGVYLICRMSFVFVLSPFTMTMVAIVGASTALVAATIALTQNDIKKVLAYSTVSQLGFMFLGVGVGAFTSGFFHVFTHAFFKACLFLGAGSVIHAMHARIHDDDKAQDIRFMGGLRKYMPLTHWTFAASTAAIIGLPFTSGFFSKDEILFRAFVDHDVNPLQPMFGNRHLWEPPMWIGPALYVVGLIAATMTAFYMCRLYFRTFWGDFRGWTIGRPSLLAKQELAEEKAAAHAGHEPHAIEPTHETEEEEAAEHHHEEDLSQPSYPPHESPWQMTVPLIILATFAVFAGWLNPGFHIFKGAPPMEHWLEPVFEGVATTAVKVKEGAEETPFELKVAIGGVLAFLVGTLLAYWMYVVKNGEPAKQVLATYDRIMTRRSVMIQGGVLLAVGVVAIVLDARDKMPRFQADTIVWVILVLVGIVRLTQGSAMPKEGVPEPTKRPGLDEVYDALPIAAVDSLAETAAAVDKGVVDGIIARLSSGIVAVAGTILRAFQTGVVHMYAALMVLGLAIVAGFFVVPHAEAQVVAADPSHPETNDFVITAGPGMGYSYRWDADNDGKPDTEKFTDQDRVKVHLDPDHGKASQVVNLEVVNAFAFIRRKQIVVKAPEVDSNVR